MFKNEWEDHQWKYIIYTFNTTTKIEQTFSSSHKAKLLYLAGVDTGNTTRLYFQVLTRTMIKMSLTILTHSSCFCGKCKNPVKQIVCVQTVATQVEFDPTMCSRLHRSLFRNHSVLPLTLVHHRALRLVITLR